jgi:hypothetical protein
MTPEINLASVPSDPKAALGYAELHALWKADEEAFNQGRRASAMLNTSCGWLGSGCT